MPIRIATNTTCSMLRLLDAELKKLGVKDVVYAGFMTHMCVNSTTRASFNHGYANTVVAGATATGKTTRGIALAGGLTGAEIRTLGAWILGGADTPAPTP